MRELEFSDTNNVANNTNNNVNNNHVIMNNGVISSSNSSNHNDHIESGGGIQHFEFVPEGASNVGSISQQAQPQDLLDFQSPQQDLEYYQQQEFFQQQNEQQPLEYFQQQHEQQHQPLENFQEDQHQPLEYFQEEQHQPQEYFQEEQHQPQEYFQEEQQQPQEYFQDQQYQQHDEEHKQPPLEYFQEQQHQHEELAQQPLGYFEQPHDQQQHQQAQLEQQHYFQQQHEEEQPHDQLHQQQVEEYFQQQHQRHEHEPKHEKQHEPQHEPQHEQQNELQQDQQQIFQQHERTQELYPQILHNQQQLPSPPQPQLEIQTTTTTTIQPKLPSPLSPKPNLQLHLQQEEHEKPHNEPVNRGEPVEKVQAPDTAKVMKQLFESGRLAESRNVQKTLPDVDFEGRTPGSGVFENEPIRLEGVVRSDDVIIPEGELKNVSTKSKLDDYLEKSKSEFVIKRAPVKLAEDEGKIIENAPTVRTDVIREQDQSELETILPQEGQTRALKEQWMSMKNEFVKENKPIKLVEREGEKSVAENEPEIRRDVLREDDPQAEENELLKRGLTNNLKSYWTNYKDREIYARDNPVLIPGPDGKTASVLENDPIVLENVAREQDLSKFEVDNIERGKAKILANKWTSMDDKFQPKDFFNMETELATSKNAGVFENTPQVVRDDVVRSGEVVQEVVTKEGVAKLMSERFKDSEFWNPKSPKSPPVLELAEGPGVHENVPACPHPDIVRCDVDSDQVILSNLRQGLTSDLVGKWKRQDVVGAQLAMPDKSYFNQPSKLLEKERASDSGVYENKPEVRKDVFREEDIEPEMVSASKTRNLRAMWSKMGEEQPKKSGVPKQIRFTPPRDKSPPSLTSPENEYKSVHNVRLSDC